MCNINNSPIEPRYHNQQFNDLADSCLVDVINHLNQEFATVASCCGHGKDIPYITVIQPLSSINKIRDILVERLGWFDMEILIFNDMPDDVWDQLGDFMINKVYVGYYSDCSHDILEDDYVVWSECDNCVIWSEDEI